MIELIPTIATSFATAMSTNAFSKAKGPAQALDDLMVLSGFEKLHFYAEKKRAETEVKVQIYKETIAQKIIQIPEENIQEPTMSIVGPVLEASKYYIEEEELRTMFANLIASSMDKTKSPQVHPSFVEVIKQMSSKEALLLKNLKSRNPFGKIVLKEKQPDYSIEEYLQSNSNNAEEINKIFGTKTKTVLDYFYYSKNSTDYFDNEFSISALNRLGLIQIENHIVLSDDDIYKELDNQFQIFEGSEFIKLISSPNSSLELQKGTIDISPFGLFFCNSCFD